MRNKKYKSHNIDVFKVVDYLLCKADDDAGDCISNLKLQKLLYYSQGFVLAITGKSLFTNDILAWEHGPVIKEVYDNYKHYQAQGIDCKKEFDENYFDPIVNSEIGEILDEVWEVYGQFSAWKLRNMTHDETPWKNTQRNDIIANELICKYFKTQIENG